MGKRQVYSIVLALVLACAGSASAGLVAHWQLDDGAGTTATDATGHGYNGTLLGGPAWVVGNTGGGLELDGRDDYVDFGKPSGWPIGKAPRSMSGWARTDSVGSGYRWIAAYGSAQTGQAMFIGMNGSTLVAGGYGGDDVTVNGLWQVGEWFQVGLTYDGTTARAYFNGLEVGALAKNWNLVADRAHLGRQVNDAAEFWDGAVDDVRLYDHVLTAAEMKALVPPKVKARKPSPADGAVGVVMPLFTWTPGETAVFQDVYLGTTPELTAADRVSTHQLAMLKMYYHLQPLTPGQTYYWRVDGIDAAGAVFTGDVWSFSVASQKAWSPQPANGAAYIDPNIELQWTAGMNAVQHDVYFGPDAAAVRAGTGDTFKGSQVTVSYTPGPLSRGVAYYWRVDETIGGTKIAGDVWGFSVRPVLPKTDPALVGWYKLDNENSGSVVDYSGYDYYGVLRGNPRWVEGTYGDALDFDGADDFVNLGDPRDWPSGRSPRSLCGWAKTHTVAGGWRWIAAYGSPNTGLAMFIGLNGTALYGGGYGDDIYRDGFWEPDVWHHICLTYDGTTAVLYADGVQVDSAAKSWNLTPLAARIGRQVNELAEFWDGVVDDVRVYNVALTPEQVQQAMRGDPLLAYDPQPPSGANLDIRDAADLQWSAGEKAAQHDVYFGKEREAVKTANTTSPLYLGRQAGTSFSLNGLVEFGGGAYFWRVDEVEADGATLHKGIVWSFTIPAYLIVDEFERYTDQPDGEIYSTWIDGYSDRLSGSTVGYIEARNGTFGETTIVHGGRQSMPMDYDNAGPFSFSEAVQTFSPLQDWTGQDVNTLSLWVRGYPAPTAVTVTETGGKISLTGSGTDIWNSSDELTFAYKMLTGDGSIVARVVSTGAGSNTWAKGGVMIRDSLNGGSTHAMVVITGGGGNGASLQWRLVTDGPSSNSDATNALTPPYWVKIERVGDTLNGYLSADGKNWTQQGLTQGIAMAAPVYLGLCVTSHAGAEPRTYQFDSVSTTGGVSGSWQGAVIAGPRSNDPAHLYVTVEDSAGKTATASDPVLVNATAWTHWKVPLTSLTGVNLSKIKKLYLGVGDKENPVPGGTGRIYIDDIQVIK